MDNTTTIVDSFFSMFSVMIDSSGAPLNLSLTFESVLSSSQYWNKTYRSFPYEEDIIIHRHPILYGTAIYAILLIIIGTIGNILTIIVLLRPNLRQYTTMRYLTAVAIADLCSLYSWNLNLIYKHLVNPYQNDLEDLSIVPCRVISFLAFVSLQLSSWYLTLVSVDRCLNINFLFWNRMYGRASYSIYIIFTITVIIILLNVHLLFYNGYQVSDCVPYKKRTCFICYASATDRHYIFPKWEKIHLIVYNFIPFSIMLVSACFIIFRSNTFEHYEQTSAVDIRNHSILIKIRRRKQRQITRILLFVTFLFVFLTTPVMVYNAFFRNKLRNRKPLKYFLQGILGCVQFTSHAINFFVYCYGASKFRYELDELFSIFVKRKDYVMRRFTTNIQMSDKRPAK